MLAPAAAAGCPYCFDPDSTSLREALSRHAPSAGAPIPAAALAEDVRWYHGLLRRQYAGYIDLVRHPSFDVNAFFAAWAETLRCSGSALPFRNAVVEPLITLRLAVPDGHLTFRGADPLVGADARIAAYEYQAVVRAAPTAGPEAVAAVPGVWPSTWRTAPLLRVGGSVTTVATLSARGCGDSRTLSLANGDHLELHRRPPPPEAPGDQRAYTWRTVDDVAVITLRRFGGPPALQEQLRRFVGDYPRHVTASSVLFDLRGNNGGSLGFILEWIAQARGGEARGLAPLETAVWPWAGAWNRLVEDQIRHGDMDKEEAREERRRVRESWPSAASPLRLLTVTNRAASPGPYEGRVFVAVDRGSGSSGERAAVDLRRLLGAILIGERTSGGMQYGQACRFVLPQTGLVCQLPIRRIFFDQEVESVGFPVDVYLEDIGQAAEALIPHLDRIADVVRGE